MVNAENKIFFVIDMKSFFASVECSERSLDAMTTKLVVADETRGENTVCLAVSPELKKMGVKNRCRLFEIPKEYNFIVAPPRMSKYIEYAAKIYSIYLKYIDKKDIHVYSIDECFIDATDYLKLYNVEARVFAKNLMQEIWQNLGIPSSCGIGTNMYLAKIALDITAKHNKDRIGFLNKDLFIRTLWHHQPLNDFWGISSGTIDRLSKYGLHDMSDIAHFDEDTLYREFGVNAELIIDHAWGEESCQMRDIKSYHNKTHSISQSQILPCNYSFEDAKIVLKEMVQNGCYELSKRQKSTELVYVYVGYGDRRGSAKGCKHVGSTTNIYSLIGQVAEEIFEEVVDKNRPIRKLGFAFCNLLNENDENYGFFIDIDGVIKEKTTTKAILNIKSKYGKNSVLKALDLNEKATQKERNQTIGGHRSGEDDK